jgi:outer membrane receptor protein involved in Fe transport
MKKLSTGGLLRTCLTLAIASAPVALAQDDADDEVFELSPFQVSSQGDTGYQATNSLAGTRLNTPLRDVASTVSVVTKQFLQDTGSTDLQELLVYTAGTEIGGAGGNFSNPDGANTVSGVQDPNFREPVRNTRVRGLAAADLTRNYFPTLVPMDGYNTDRIVINRGANATLFGLGSPAGIINNQTIGTLYGDHTEFGFEFGSYGSKRYTFDIERVLIEDKLTVRVAALLKDRKWQQHPSHEKDKRLTAVLGYKPDEFTTINLSYETGYIDANRPRTLPPQDLVSAWFLPGPEGTPKPTHNPYQGGGTNYRYPGTYVPDDLSTPDVNEWKPGVARSNYFGFGGYTFEPVLVYDSPTAKTPGGPLGFDGITYIQPGGNRGRDFSNGANAQSFATMRGTAENLGAVTPDHPDSLDQNGFSKAATKGFYTNHVVQDDSFFDFRNKLIDGPNKREQEWFDVMNFSIDRTFMEGKAGVSYQFNKEEYGSDFDAKMGIGSRFQGLGIDVNTHTRSGANNPNFGRVWISGSRGPINTSDRNLENHRATGFYKMDFTEQVDGLAGKLLGNHTATLLLEDSRDNSTSIAWFQPSFDGNWLTVGDGRRLDGTVQIVGNNAAGVAHLVYVSDSLAGASSSAGANVSNWQAKFDLQPEYSIQYQHYGDGDYKIGTFGVTERAHAGNPSQNNNTIKQKINIESQAIVLQSKFLDDHIVANWGYREDDVQAFTNDSAPSNADKTQNISPTAWKLPRSPTFMSATDATNWGVVAHLPDAWMDNLGGMGLSFHYAESANAQIGTERSNILGESLAPVSGQTTEVGFTLRVNNWLSLRYNDYETMQIGETNTSLTEKFRPLTQVYGNFTSPIIRQEVADYVRDNPADWPAVASNPDAILGFMPYSSSLGQTVASVINSRLDANGFEMHDNPSSLTFTSDLLSEGKEIEAVVNLSENWRLMFNASQQQVTATNTGGLFKQFIEEEVNPNLAEFGGFPLSEGGSESLFNWLDRNAITAINLALATDGGKLTNEVREWRFNAVTNYTFAKDSALKGWNVGGAMRWQDKVGIGRELTTDALGLPIPDINSPFFGPTETAVDAWVGFERPIKWGGQDLDWRVQLNVRNLLDEKGLIPVRADPDGGISVIRIPVEQTWELSNTFRF